MKKKYIIKVAFIAFMMFVTIFTSTVFAEDLNPDAPTMPKLTGEISEISNATSNLWATFTVVAQTLAIAAIVFAGVRYMISSADDRADIKAQTLILVLGAVLVFAALPFTQFVVNTINELF